MENKCEFISGNILLLVKIKSQINAALKFELNGLDNAINLINKYYTKNGGKSLIDTLEMSGFFEVDDIHRELGKRLKEQASVKEKVEDVSTEPTNDDLDNLDFGELQSTNVQLNKLFKKAKSIERLIRKKFEEDIVEKCLVDYVNLEIILQNSVSLNKHIYRYKVKQLEILANYLKGADKITNIPKDLSDSKNYDTLLNFYWYIMGIADKMFSPENITYIKTAYRSNDQNFMLAFYAYVILSPTNENHALFDDLLHDAFPKMFSIETFNVFPKMNSEAYRLNFQRGVNKPFGNERMEDGEKTMGVLGKLLLATTPKLDINGNVTDKYLKYEEIEKTFDKLKYLFNNKELSSKSTLENLAAKLYGPECIDVLPKLILLFLNEEQDYSGVINFSAEEKAILKSIYNRFFNTKNKNSLINIENLQYRTGNILSFSLLSTVVGALLRLELTAYLQISPDFNDPNRALVADTISKRNERNILYNFHTTLASEIKHSKTLKESCINRYSLNLDKDTKEIFFILTINGKTYNFKFLDFSANLDNRLQIEIDGRYVSFINELKGEKNIFPTYDVISKYLTDSNYNVQETNEYLLVILKLLKMLCELTPSLHLDLDNLQVIINLLLNFAYDTNYKNGKNIFSIIHEIIYPTARNILITLSANDAKIKSESEDLDFDKLSYIRDEFSSFFYGKDIINRKLHEYYTKSTNSLRILWEGEPSSIWLNLAKTYVEHIGKVFRTIKDAQFNSLPLTRLYTIINHIAHYLKFALSESDESILRFNLFNNTTNLYNLGKTEVYIDAKTQTGEVKKAKELTLLERLYDLLVNRFLSAIANNQTHVRIQPTTFADKSTINVVPVPIRISTNEQSINIKDLFFTDPSKGIKFLKETIQNTFGEQILKLSDNIILDYCLIFSNLDNKILQQILDNLNSLSINNDNVSDDIKSTFENFINQAKSKLNDINKFKEDLKNSEKIFDEKDEYYTAFLGLLLGTTPELIVEIKKKTSELNKEGHDVHFIEDTHYSILPVKNLTNDKSLSNYCGNLMIYYLSTVVFDSSKKNGILDSFYSSNLIEYVKKIFNIGLSINDPNIDKVIKKLPNAGKEWYSSNGSLILAKNIQNGELIAVDTIDQLTSDSVVNPIIELFFYAHFLYAENINLITSGGEWGHSHKLKGVDAKRLEKFLDLIILEDSGRTTNSFKRTVDQGVPGIKPIFDISSMLPFARYAIISDLKAPVYNIGGETDNIDSLDGCALTCPLHNILLRMSQQDCAGAKILKLILRAQWSKYGTNVIFKYADDSFFNAQMRDSMSGGGIDLEAKFKEMCSLEFDKEYDKIDKIPDKAKTIVIRNEETGEQKEIPYEIDLTKDLFGRDMQPSKMSEGRPIIFRLGSRHFELTKLERVIDNNGIVKYKPTYREVFLLDGKLLVNQNSKYAEILSREPIIINTLYQLFLLLGGVYSEKVVNGKFVYCDYSLYTLANYCNNVGRVYDPKTGRKSYAYPTLGNTWQPLKTKYIASLVNLSACKNGGDMVNPLEAWLDRHAKLMTTILPTDSQLLVQDYDHIVTDGTTALSEFTLVMSATILFGTSYPEVKELWTSLANISAANMKELHDDLYYVLDKTGEIDPNKKDRLYYTICKLLLRGFDEEGNNTSLLLNYIAELRELFDELREDFSKAQFKIPFSDSLIFANSCVKLLSAVNKFSIKRKYPGSGLVMIGAYGLIRNFLFPHMPNMQYSDVLKWLFEVPTRTLENGNTQFISGWNNNKNQILVEINEKGEIVNILFLETTFNYKTNTLETVSSNIESLDNLSSSLAIHLYRILNSASDIYGKIVGSGNLSLLVSIINLYINTLKYDLEFGLDFNKLYVEKFKGFIRDFQATYISNNPLSKERKFVSDLQLLLAVIIHNVESDTWEAVTIDSMEKLEKYSSSEYDYFYIDYSTPRDLLPANITFTDKKTGKKINLFNLPSIKEQIRIIQNTESIKEKNTALRIIDSITNKLYQGKYDIINDNGDIEEREIVEGSLIVTDYEARIPRIFAKEYDILEGDNLFDILQEGPEFFIKRYNEKHNPILSPGQYSICLTMPSGKHRYITFKRPESKSREIAIDNLYTEIDDNYIWVVDKNGNRLYPRYIIERDNSGLPRRDDNGDIIRKDCIIKYLSPANSNEEFYYCSEPEYVNLLSNGAETIIISDTFTHTTNGKRDDAKVLYEILSKNTLLIINKGEYLAELKEILNEDFSKSQEAREKLHNIIAKVNDRQLLFKHKAQSKFNSFKEALKLIVARIPALNLQSYMNMRVVGFIDTDSNVIQVSHFQTYILGSDYDIDKGNTMMLAIRKNGLPYLWSPFFQTAYDKLFQEGLNNIPLPSGKEVKLLIQPTTTINNNVIDITDIINELLNYVSEDSEINYYSADINPIVIKLLKQVGLHEYVTVNEVMYNEHSEVIHKILLDVINKHTLWFSNLYSKYDRSKPNRNDIVAIFKNFVFYKLRLISADIRNLRASLTPVSMGETRTAADASPLGQESKVRTRFNPATISESTTEFLSGKSAVGVAANGAKTNFALIYDYIRRMQDGSVSDRIRSNFMVKFNGTYYVNLMRCINQDILPESEELMYSYLESFLKSKNYSEEEIKDVINAAKKASLSIDTSMVISALISAATDNAKELILKKINAESKYLNLYIFGTIIGIPFIEISNLMTSELINYSINSCEENFFIGLQNLKIEDTFNLILGGAGLPNHTVIRDFFVEYFEQEDTIKLIESDFKSFVKLLYFELNLEQDTHYYDELNTINLDDIYNKLVAHLKKNGKSSMIPKVKEAFSRIKEYKKFKITEAKALELIEDYKTLKKGGSEITNLSKFLKINLGIPVVPGDLINYLSSLDLIIINLIKGFKRGSEEELLKSLINLYIAEGLTQLQADAKARAIIHSNAYKDIINGEFDIVKLFNLKDKQYLKDTIELMEVTKFAFNILDVVINNPNINQAFKDGTIGTRIMDALTTRQKTLKRIYRKLFPERAVDLNRQQWAKIGEVIDTQIIYDWLSKQNIKITLRSGDNVIHTDANTNKKTEITFLGESKTLLLSDEDSIATFLSWFKTTFYDIIKNPDKYSNLLSNEDISRLKSNYLINNLRITSFRDNYFGVDVEAVLLPIDFTLLNSSNINNDTLEECQAYIDALEEIKDIKIDGMRFADWLFLYTLLMFKNLTRKENLRPIFENIVTQDYLIREYFEYLGERDYNLELVIPRITLKTFQKAIAPIVTTASVTNPNIYNNYEYVRFNNSDGGYSLWLKYIRNNTDSEFFEEDESDNYSRKIKLENYVEDEYLGDPILSLYYRFNLSDYEKDLSEIKLTETISFEELHDKIIKLIEQNVLNILINC